jgi:hypothetical protein
MGMTIRYQCHSCGSKLNIKEELAGTAGKCPKCKTEFTVPGASPAAPEKAAPVAAASASKERPPAKTKAAAKSRTAAASGQDDFDPVAFLMDDEPSASTGSAAPPLSDDEIPADLELEIGDDEPPRRRTRSRRRVKMDSDDELEIGSASESAGAMLSGASSGAARDLLTRTVEESRARASRIDEEEVREPSAAWEIGREIAVRALPGILGVLVVAFLLYRGIDALMGSGMELPDLGQVSGTVMLDGKPLAGARVTFNPVKREIEVSETREIRVRPSTAITDENGYYELNYTQDIPGVAVGDHYVSISKRDGARELAPSEYGPYSRVKHSVAAGSQQIDIALQSDARR